MARLEDWPSLRMAAQHPTLFERNTTGGPNASAPPVKRVRRSHFHPRFSALVRNPQ
jgi:hypothetical protein